MSILSASSTDKYEIVVGLEVHIQLATASKAFCRDGNQFNSAPNTMVSPVSLALPGSLPFVNENLINYAVKLGLATSCEINRHNYFDRKNYFYADLPKGYQITQDNAPICVSGKLNIRLKDDAIKCVRINRIHMEEDAGKSIHDLDDHYSFIDLNRAGVPLLELVTEPDIRSGAEANAFLTEIRKLVRFLEICDGNMEEGSMRCDANISIRKKGDENYGLRCEVKNLNSMKNVQKAIDAEAKRQISLIESGEKVKQQTLNFNAATGEIMALRSKETANDYRYFPEPDLPPIHLSEVYIEDIKQSLPELPEEVFQRLLNQHQLSEYDADILSSEKEMVFYYDELIDHDIKPKSAANWLNGAIKSYLNDQNISITNFPVKAEKLAALIKLVDTGKINHLMAKEQVFKEMIKQPEEDVLHIATRLNALITETNVDDLQLLIDKSLALHPTKILEYKNGKKGVIGLFMGELMKLTKGKIDPKKANEMLLKKLES